jgi:KDO2-lipid IV(A) lauroyltransferase
MTTDGSVEAAGTKPAAERGASGPPRWTLHRLNNGYIFGATCRLVAALPVRVSYAIGDLGTWIAWRFMAQTRLAIADNLGPILPDEPAGARERRALRTLRVYARDVVDFLRAVGQSNEERRRFFEFDEQQLRLIQSLLARHRGILLVGGHYGNWEIGSVLLHVFDLPLTIVAKEEDSAEVTRRRREIRDSLGVDTIYVRQSMETPLQIRRRLVDDNRIVAILMDRHVDRDRVEVTLAGRRAWFLRTPAVMGLVSGAPLLPCFIERVGPARFKPYIGEPIFVATDIPRDQAIRAAAQRFADQFGERLHAHPEYWYTFYRYWDTQVDEHGA